MKCKSLLNVGFSEPAQVVHPWSSPDSEKRWSWDCKRIRAVALHNHRGVLVHHVLGKETVQTSDLGKNILPI
jgi:hypothetical protein